MYYLQLLFFLFVFNLKSEQFEFVMLRLLSALLTGVSTTVHRYIVLTTSAGIMDHEEARRKHTGGKILGFFF